MNTSSVADLDGTWSIDCAALRHRICALPTCGCPHHRRSDVASSDPVGEPDDVPRREHGPAGSDDGAAAMEPPVGSDPRGCADAVPRESEAVGYEPLPHSGRLKAS